jgi:D-alanyl-D-alanine carboxypeptidase
MPLLLAVLLVATACGASGTEAATRSPSSTAGSNASRFSRAVLEGMLREHAEQHNAGVIALVETHGRIWRGAAGLVQGERPTHPRDVFDMGSTAKTFEATVVLQLVDEGRLSLDDTLERWLPGLVRGGSNVLIRYLLNHTSGVTDSRSGGVRYEVSTTPGTTYAYSNLGYGLLAQIVSEVTGHSLQQEVRRRILLPLHLSDTWTTYPQRSSSWLGPELPPAARGGPLSTTSDLARFFLALLRGRLLREDTMAEMTKTIPTGSGNFGLGLFQADFACGSAWGHGGDTLNYTNFVSASRDGSTIVVVARNSGGWWTLRQLAEEIYCQVL